MDYQQIIDLVVKSILIPIIPLVGIYFTLFIQKQINKIRLQTEIEELHYYLDLAENLIISSVAAIQQTYVDKLKQEGFFTIECQKEAFDLAKNRINLLMKEEGVKAIEKAHGDYLNYIETKIEQIINEKKTERK